MSATAGFGPMTLGPRARETLKVLRRLGWTTAAIYTALTGGLWLAQFLLPGSMGPVTNYTVEVSLIAAATFGGLYTAGSLLLPSKHGGTGSRVDS